MMKKKSVDPEEKKEAKQTKQVDNKDDTTNLTEKSTTEHEAGNDDAPDVAGETTTTVTDQESDKTVPAEKLLEEKLAEMQDRYLRLSAEFDNYRKRTLKEKMDLTRYAGENLIIKLLPFMDDFERALRHMENLAECAPLKEGIDLIYLKLSDFLKSQGVKEIDSMNCKFDVDIHEAVAKVPVDEKGKKGMVVDVVLKGYYLQDKVIRHSKVVIGE